MAVYSFDELHARCAAQVNSAALGLPVRTVYLWTNDQDVEEDEPVETTAQVLIDQEQRKTDPSGKATLERLTALIEIANVETVDSSGVLRYNGYYYRITSAVPDGATWTVIAVATKRSEQSLGKEVYRD